MAKKQKDPRRRFLISTQKIELIVYDFDGVMTDNNVIVFEDGREAVVCSRSDGMAIQSIKKLGIHQLILSTEENRVVRARAKKLGIEVIQGARDKKTLLLEYCRKNRYRLGNVLYVGNDLNDLEAMQLVGFPVVPSDANIKIRKIAKMITRAKGGEGVIRELYDRFI